MTHATHQKPPRISFLEWLRELDEALNLDPIEDLNNRFDRLEAKLEATDAIRSANPPAPAINE